MRITLHTKYLWDVVLNEFEEPLNEKAIETTIQDEKNHLIEKKDDAITLFLIQQGLDERILLKIATTTRSKEVLDILEMA
jgi:hypothetical protein